MTGSTVSGNTATGSGGGIYSTGNLTVTNSAVSGNSTPRDGGGILPRKRAPRRVVTNSTINGNSADGNGGGIFGSNLTRDRQHDQRQLGETGRRRRFRRQPDN